MIKSYPFAARPSRKSLDSALNSTVVHDPVANGKAVGAREPRRFRDQPERDLVHSLDHDGRSVQLSFGLITGHPTTIPATLVAGYVANRVAGRVLEQQFNQRPRFEPQ